MKNKLLKKLLLPLALLLGSFIYAQSVTGTVSDASGPLPGVNVLVKGTSTGTVTDFDGNFTIAADSGTTLVFSFIGYLTQHVLTRSSGGAKLPSVGLCLNASKAESRLVMATIPLGLLFCSGSDSLRTPSRSGELCCLAQSAGQLSSSSTWQSGGPKSSVDDLCAGRGVVLGRDLSRKVRTL